MGWGEELLVDAIPLPELECPICFDLMKDSVMGECQHTCCSDCLIRMNSICSQCRCKISNPIPNRLARSIIDRMKIKCVNVVKGCNTQTEIAMLDVHVQKCPFATIVCDNSGCGEELFRKDLETHKSTCSHEKSLCPHCKISLFKREVASHSCLANLLEIVTKLQDQVNALAQAQKLSESRERELISQNEEITRRLMALERASGNPSSENANSLPGALAYPNFGRWTLKRLSTNGDLIITNSISKVSLQFVRDSNGWFRFTRDGREATVYSHFISTKPAEPPSMVGENRPYTLPNDKHKTKYSTFINPSGALFIYTHYLMSPELVILFPNNDDVIFHNINNECFFVL